MRSPKPVLALLHGWGMNVRVFDVLAALLADDFEVHALNLPGHGGCAAMPDNTLASWAKRSWKFTPTMPSASPTPGPVPPPVPPPFPPGPPPVPGPPVLPVPPGPAPPPIDGAPGMKGMSPRVPNIEGSAAVSISGWSAR